MEGKLQLVHVVYRKKSICVTLKRYQKKFWINPWGSINSMLGTREYFSLNLSSKKPKRVMCDNSKVVKYRKMYMTSTSSPKTMGEPEMREHFSCTDSS